MAPSRMEGMGLVHLGAEKPAFSTTSFPTLAPPLPWWVVCNEKRQQGEEDGYSKGRGDLTWLIRMPVTMASWCRVPRAPRRVVGAISPMYIGTSPEINPVWDTNMDMFKWNLENLSNKYVTQLVSILTGSHSPGILEEPLSPTMGPGHTANFSSYSTSFFVCFGFSKKGFISVTALTVLEPTS